MKVLYLEDDPGDIALFQQASAGEEPDCELTAVTDRASFVAGLQSGSYAGILSDSGVFDLAGPDAVKLARILAPALPYVFLCGTMSDGRRAELLASEPEGIFTKDRPGDFGLAIGLLRKLAGERSQRRAAD
jgi:CheY-like chemotaxis protein